MLRPALLIGLTPLLLSCGASLRDVYMAKDGQGSVKATKFNAIGDEIHCIIVVLGGDEETRVALDLTGPDGVHLSDDEIYPRPTSDKQGPVTIDFQLFQIDAMGDKVYEGLPELPWPIGDYTMKVSLDDELEETLEFSVD
jgi:hypothetical protein